MSRRRVTRVGSIVPAPAIDNAVLSGEALLRALTGVREGDPLAGMDTFARNLTLLVVACESSGHRLHAGRLPRCLDCGAFLTHDWHGWRAVRIADPPQPMHD